MSIPAKFEKEFAAFPLELRKLVLDELAAGNAIEEFCGGFPAPLAGNCLKLAKPVSTRPRESTPAVKFYERNSSSYSGEFTDAQRFFFVLEPPLSSPAPDMSSIRADIEARERAADAELFPK